MTYNEALTDIATQLLDDYGLTPEQIDNLAADIPGEVLSIIENRIEAAWEREQDRLREAFHSGEDSGYRKAMRDAGRGYLVKP